MLLYESVRTTKKRAEVVQPMIEKIITTAKTKDARNAIRAINAYVTHVNACKKVMELLKDRYAKRSSGYTSMIPLGLRHGDGAKMVELSLMDSDVGKSSDSPDERVKRATTVRAAKKKSSPSSSPSRLS